jgi:GAF domain-containing protein
LLGAGIVGALVILLLAAAKSAHIELASSADESEPIDQVRPADEGFSLREQPQPPAPSSSRVVSPMLKVAAEVCTDFGRVQDIEELKNVLGRAARVIEANGAVVWLGSTAGADLRPVLAHGYSSQTVARMQSVPKSADNAAAAAYRTGALQIVLSQPGGSTGAIVAPLLSPDGCIGALSVETKGGGETSDSIQALAGIFAAQLAGVLAASAAETASAETKTAAQG